MRKGDCVTKEWALDYLCIFRQKIARRAAIAEMEGYSKDSTLSSVKFKILHRKF